MGYTCFSTKHLNLFHVAIYIYVVKSRFWFSGRLLRASVDKPPFRPWRFKFTINFIWVMNAFLNAFTGDASAWHLQLGQKGILENEVHIPQAVEHICLQETGIYKGIYFFSISCVHTTSCKEFSWSIFACSIHPIFPLWIPNWNIDNYRVPPLGHFPASIVANCLQVMRKKGLNVWKVRSSFVKRKKRRQWPSGMVMRDGSCGYLHYVGYHIILGKSPWTIGSTEVWFDTKSQGCTCKEILAAFWKGSKRSDI